jgi:hypothetical protein
MMASTNKLAGDYIKSHSVKAKDIMTCNVLSVVETTLVADIALLLETNRINMFPSCAMASSWGSLAERPSCEHSP